MRRWARVDDRTEESMLSKDALFWLSLRAAGTASCVTTGPVGGAAAGLMMGLYAQEGKTNMRWTSLPCTGAGGGLADFADMGQRPCEKITCREILFRLFVPLA